MRLDKRLLVYGHSIINTIGLFATFGLVVYLAFDFRRSENSKPCLDLLILFGKDQADHVLNEPALGFWSYFFLFCTFLGLIRIVLLIFPRKQNEEGLFVVKTSPTQTLNRFHMTSVLVIIICPLTFTFYPRFLALGHGHCQFLAVSHGGKHILLIGLLLSRYLLISLGVVLALSCFISCFSAKCSEARRKKVWTALGVMLLIFLSILLGTGYFLTFEYATFTLSPPVAWFARVSFIMGIGNAIIALVLECCPQLYKKCLPSSAPEQLELKPQISIVEEPTRTTQRPMTSPENIPSF
eukprot:TRINITY_DN13108_c0_g1_i2.p1 TRINITY_DN13108_c0_g1~~TRINITY_DN13108_c0_g1_i2.p1  ORF type:complete len:296 (+),score=4.60 TRINITY_DN13108_c0_g1_i2:61-948(+)